MASGRKVSVTPHAMAELLVVPKTPCILFASSAEQPAPYSLARALALADHHAIRLQVLRVLPRQSLVAAMVAPFLQNDDMGQVTRFLGDANASSRWYATVLGARFNEDHVLLSIGGFAEEVATQARAVRAIMIVVPAGEWSGSAITGLACRARLPVLVVREVDGARSVIAATDLGVDRISILEQALELGQHLNAGVVAMHNISPSMWGDAARNDGALSAIAIGSSVRTSVITRRSNHAEGILGEARMREADTVVVGTHARSGMASAVRRSVAAQVVDGALRSVLVVPVDLLL